MTSPSRIGKLSALRRRTLERLGIDRAVLWAVLGRVWGPLAGAVTLLLIGSTLSIEVQGYYYTFSSILALQVFAELGLGTVLLFFASAEWANLQLDAHGRIDGDAAALSRLASLTKFGLSWYLVAGLALTSILGSFGWYFFSGREGEKVNWLLPWVTLCVVAGLNLQVLGAQSILEGCNQVVGVYYSRLVQSVFQSVAIWASLAYGADLWALSIGGFAAFVAALFALRGKELRLLVALLRHVHVGPAIRWTRELLPMQWRIAVGWASGYFAFSLFTPILFHYHGPVVAGQMGMTLALTGAVHVLSIAVLSPKTTQFGILVSRRDYRELDSLYLRTTVIVIGMAILGAGVVGAGAYYLNVIDHALSGRILAVEDVILFLMSTILVVALAPIGTYLRAHRQEPLFLITVVFGALTGVSTWILGKYYGAHGMALGYLTINLLVTPIVVVLWRKYRKKWH